MGSEYTRVSTIYLFDRKGSNYVYLGVIRHGDQWVSEKTGEAVNYTNWYSAMNTYFPTESSGHDCVVIQPSTNSWRNYLCTGTYYAVCTAVPSSKFRIFHD